MIAYTITADTMDMRSRDRDTPVPEWGWMTLAELDALNELEAAAVKAEEDAANRLKMRERLANVLRHPLQNPFTSKNRAARRTSDCSSTASLAPTVVPPTTASSHHSPTTCPGYHSPARSLGSRSHKRS